MPITDTGTGAGAQGERASGVTGKIASTLEAGKAGLSRVADSATEAGKQRLDASIFGAADQVEQVGDALSEAALRLESSDQLGGLAAYTGRLADALGELAEQIRTRSIEDLAAEARRAARSNPVLFLAGSVVVGFALMRILKAGRTAAEQGGGAEYAAGHPGDAGYAAGGAGYDGQDFGYSSGDSRRESGGASHYSGVRGGSGGNVDMPPSQASVPEATRGAGVSGASGSASTVAGATDSVTVPSSQASVPAATRGPTNLTGAAGEPADLPVDERLPTTSKTSGESRSPTGGQDD